MLNVPETRRGELRVSLVYLLYRTTEISRQVTIKPQSAIHNEVHVPAFLHADPARDDERPSRCRGLHDRDGSRLSDYEIAPRHQFRNVIHESMHFDICSLPGGDSPFEPQIP